MIKLRTFLCHTFGTLALIFLAVSLGTVPELFRPIHPHGFPHVDHPTAFQVLLGGVLLALARLLLLMPLAEGVLYGMAWWRIRSGNNARVWAIAASVGMLLFSLPQVAVVYYMLRYWSTIHWSTLHGGPRFIGDIGILCGITVAIGIAGLVAFGPRDASVQPRQVTHPPRIAGDGTSGLMDTFSVVLAIAGYIAGMRWWILWARAHGLPLRHGSLLQIALVLLLTTALHEMGHTAVGLAVGMKLRAFIVGPFQWRIRSGRWTFKFLLGKVLGGGGAAGLVPTRTGQSRWNEIGMIAAGPLASLLTGLAFGALALTAPGRSYEGAWRLFALTSTIALLDFAVNLIPLRPEGLYSDGARIYQLLQGGAWADLHQALSVVASTGVTPLRPRDYDMDAILRAQQSFTTGRHGMLLRLFASSYYLDRGDTRSAAAAFEDAEAAYRASPFDLPTGLYAVFVFGHAYLRHDAVRARDWWDQMEAKKPDHLGVDYWLAKATLLSIENRPQEAQEAWATGEALARELPAAGDYDFDRSRYVMVGKALNQTLVAQ